MGSLDAVVIAGAGGMAREAYAWLKDAQTDARVLGFVAAPGAAEGTVGTMLDLPVWSSFAACGVTPGELGIVLGIGSPMIRRRVAAEAGEIGAALVTVVHPTAYVGPGVELAPGAIVCPNATLTRDITVDHGAIINYAAAVGHDCLVGAFGFVGPGVTLGGEITIGSDAYVGLGACILPGRSIGRGAVVGAGAVVTRDVPDGVTVVGSPAREHAPSTTEGSDP